MKKEKALLKIKNINVENQNQLRDWKSKSNKSLQDENQPAAT